MSINCTRHIFISHANEFVKRCICGATYNTITCQVIEPIKSARDNILERIEAKVSEITARDKGIFCDGYRAGYSDGKNDVWASGIAWNRYYRDGMESDSIDAENLFPQCHEEMTIDLDALTSPSGWIALKVETHYHDMEHGPCKCGAWH